MEWLAVSLTERLDFRALNHSRRRNVGMDYAEVVWIATFRNLVNDEGARKVRR